LLPVGTNTGDGRQEGGSEDLILDHSKKVVEVDGISITVMRKGARRSSHYSWDLSPRRIINIKGHQRSWNVKSCPWPLYPTLR